MCNREEFERVFKSVFKGHRMTRGANGDYVSIVPWAAWKVWQAARQAPASGEVEPVDEKGSLPLFCRVYNSGYHAGHHDTVEGGYTHIYPQDMDDYHEEVVVEILEDLQQEAYTHPPAKVPESELIDHIDLMADEFKRIKALNPSPEIIDLCERALRVTEQNVPVLRRVEKLEKCISSLLWENSELKERLAATPTPATTPETEWVPASVITPEIIDWAYCGMATNGRHKEQWAVDMFRQFRDSVATAKATPPQEQ